MGNESNKKTLYIDTKTITCKNETKNGANQTVDRVEYQGIVVYHKKQLKNDMIENYELLSKLGVGIPIKIISETQIIMKPGYTLNRWYQMLQDPKIDMKEFTPKVLASKMIEIQTKMKRQNIAHTDIKPANIVFCYDPFLQKQFVKNKNSQLYSRWFSSSQMKIYLIDNDHVTKFGNYRKVGTQKINCNFQKMINNQIVNEETDDEGWAYNLNLLKLIDPTISF